MLWRARVCAPSPTRPGGRAGAVRLPSSSSAAGAVCAPSHSRRAAALPSMSPGFFCASSPSALAWPAGPLLAAMVTSTAPNGVWQVFALAGRGVAAAATRLPCCRAACAVCQPWARSMCAVCFSCLARVWRAAAILFAHCLLCGPCVGPGCRRTLCCRAFLGLFTSSPAHAPTMMQCCSRASAPSC
jgi:hypothetical protein